MASFRNSPGGCCCNVLSGPYLWHQDMLSQGGIGEPIADHDAHFSFDQPFRKTPPCIIETGNSLFECSSDALGDYAIPLPHGLGTRDVAKHSWVYAFPLERISYWGHINNRDHPDHPLSSDLGNSVMPNAENISEWAAGADTTFGSQGTQYMALDTLIEADELAHPDYPEINVGVSNNFFIRNTTSQQLDDNFSVIFDFASPARTLTCLVDIVANDSGQSATVEVAMPDASPPLGVGLNPDNVPIYEVLLGGTPDFLRHPELEGESPFGTFGDTLTGTLVDDNDPSLGNLHQIKINGKVSSPSSLTITIRPQAEIEGHRLFIARVDVKPGTGDGLRDVRSMVIPAGPGATPEGSVTAIHYPRSGVEFTGEILRTTTSGVAPTSEPATPITQLECISNFDVIQVGPFGGANRATAMPEWSMLLRSLPANNTLVSGRDGMGHLNYRFAYPREPLSGGTDTVFGSETSVVRHFPFGAQNPAGGGFSAITAGCIPHASSRYGTLDAITSGFDDLENVVDTTYGTARFRPINDVTLVADVVEHEGTTISLGYGQPVNDGEMAFIPVGPVEGRFPKMVWVRRANILDSKIPRAPDRFLNSNLIESSVLYREAAEESIEFLIAEPNEVDQPVVVDRAAYGDPADEVASTYKTLVPVDGQLLFSRQHTQERVLESHYSTTLTAGAGPGHQVYGVSGYGGMHLHGHVLKSRGNELDTLTLIAYHEHDHLATGPSVFDWREAQQGIAEPTSTVTESRTTFLIVDIQGNEVASQTFTNPGYFAFAPGGNQFSANILHDTPWPMPDIAVGPSGQKVWLERVYAAGTNDPGVASATEGIRLHIDDPDVPGTVVLETDIPWVGSFASAPGIVAVNDQFVFIKDFPLTDSLTTNLSPVVGAPVLNWAISYDLTRQIPISARGTGLGVQAPLYRAFDAIQDAEELGFTVKLSECGAMGEDPDASLYPSRVPV